MDVTLFLKGLLMISVLTGLFVEATKKMIPKISLSLNLVTAIWDVIIAGFVCIAYIVHNSVMISGDVVIQIIALVSMSWVTAMVGYDKVVQTISQIK